MYYCLASLHSFFLNWTYLHIWIKNDSLQENLMHLTLQLTRKSLPFSSFIPLSKEGIEHDKSSIMIANHASVPEWNFSDPYFKVNQLLIVWKHGVGKPREG